MAILRAIPSSFRFLPIFVILTALFFISLCYQYLFLSQTPDRKKHKSSIPTNWPVIGMLPAVLRNSHRLHDYGSEVLNESGGTFELKGPWLSNVNMVLTSDPATVQYVLSKNFSNYPRGPNSQKIFDIFGHGIFNTYDELWEIHRKITLSIMHHADYKSSLQVIVLKKLEKVLLPMLGNFANMGVEIDMQDILDRFTFDVFSNSILGDDPGSLALDLPDITSRWGFSDALKVIFQSHVLPESCWKLKEWLNNFGKQTKAGKALEATNHFIYSCMEKNQQGLKFNTIAAFHQAYKTMLPASSSSIPTITDKFLRDVFFSLFAAGKDTISTSLTWFFYLVSKNPQVEAKILQELESEFPFQPWDQIISKMSESPQKLVYLHGAICETLRLFPPAALTHKTPSKPDLLPSGVSINADTKLVLSFYSMGRMESIWGKDCLVFKPERWITEQGRIKHQPSYKFVAFNSGPRACSGKDISFIIMKMVIVSLLRNYHVTIADGHHASPANSIIIHSKHGLKVMISKSLSPVGPSRRVNNKDIV